MPLEQCFEKLHYINALEQEGEEHQAMNAVELFNEQLCGTHFRCWWNAAWGEWVIQDSLLFGREKEEK